MPGQYTRLPTPIKPGDSLESKHVDVMITSLRQLRAAQSADPGFACDDVICVCGGDDDCIDLFDTELCGPHAVCYSTPEGPVCICIQA
jgi:hypothetical protein